MVRDEEGEGPAHQEGPPSSSRSGGGYRLGGSIVTPASGKGGPSCRAEDKLLARVGAGRPGRRPLLSSRRGLGVA